MGQETDLVRARFALGDAEIILCTDGPFKLDGGAMFGVVPKTLWSRALPSDDNNRVRLGLNSMVVRLDDTLLIVETGLGNQQPEKMRPILEQSERLLASWDAAGIQRADVTHVVNTHLHFDHCGWNTMPDERTGTSVPTFPRARYFAAAGELAHGRLQLERDAVSYQSRNYDPLIRSGQLTVIDLASEFADGDHHLTGADVDAPPVQRSADIAPGVWVEPLPGHTASMLGVHVASRGEHLCFVGDLFPTHHHLQPTWVMGYDLDPLRSIAEKKLLLERAIAGRWIVVFPHDHEMPAARIERDARGRYVAIAV